MLAQLSLSLELPTTNTSLLLHNHQMQNLVSSSKGPIIGAISRWLAFTSCDFAAHKIWKEDNTTAASTNYYYFTFCITGHQEGWRMEEKKLDIHNHILPKNWPDLKERCATILQTIFSHWLLGRRYGYGGWVSLDHTCGGSPKPGKANMMKVRPHIILTLFFIIIINMIIF